MLEKMNFLERLTNSWNSSLLRMEEILSSAILYKPKPPYALFFDLDK